MTEFKRNGTQLTVYLCGEIDHYSAQSIREDVETLLSRNKTDHLILDFDGVDFMDSSGVGFIIGRYKLMARRGGSVAVTCPGRRVDRIFEMSGLYQLVERLA